MSNRYVSSVIAALEKVGVEVEASNEPKTNINKDIPHSLLIFDLSPDYGSEMYYIPNDVAEKYKKELNEINNHHHYLSDNNHNPINVLVSPTNDEGGVLREYRIDDVSSLVNVNITTVYHSGLILSEKNMNFIDR